MSKVIEHLNEKRTDASNNKAKGSAVAAHEPADAEDPMAMLDEVEEKEPPTPPKNEIVPKRLGNTVLHIEMPQRPPELARPTAADVRKVSVLGKSTNQLWIAVEGVEWLINYVATEVALGGVPQLEAAAVAEGNCEVEGLRVQWNFGAQSCRAEFVSGRLNRRTCSFKCFKNERRNMGFRCCRSRG